MTIYFVVETLAKLILSFWSNFAYTNILLKSIMVRDENKPLKIKINHDRIILLI